VDALLYDPMPGGSGLLEQMLQRWPEVLKAALELVEGCSSQCNSACVDCMLLFRNSFYHQHLNRHVAAEALRAWSDGLVLTHDIPARLPDAQAQDLTVNQSAQLLKALLQRAGFSNFEEEKPIDLGRALGKTTPDFYFADPSERTEGVCLYLDGMSKHIHGNPQTRQRDQQLRGELRNLCYEVMEITYNDLHDREAMRAHFYRLGRLLLTREQAQGIRADDSWFDAKNSTP
jgi:hypothetical protein